MRPSFMHACFVLISHSTYHSMMIGKGGGGGHKHADDEKKPAYDDDDDDDDEDHGVKALPSSLSGDRGDGGKGKGVPIKIMNGGEGGSGGGKGKSMNMEISQEPLAIIMRAVSFVYRRMVAKTNEGR